MEMLTLFPLLAMKMVLLMNPVFMAISILMGSIVITMTLFKSSMSSWIAFVTILTFSSGMMTLFMYTASLSSNEKMKTNKGKTMTILMLVSILTLMKTPMKSNKNSTETMKTFSNKTMIIMMAMVLVISMIAIASHGHHPNQTISSSF